MENDMEIALYIYVDIDLSTHIYRGYRFMVTLVGCLHQSPFWQRPVSMRIAAAAGRYEKDAELAGAARVH